MAASREAREQARALFLEVFGPVETRCPRCAAAPGAGCNKGKNRARLHKARIEAARALSA